MEYSILEILLLFIGSLFGGFLYTMLVMLFLGFFYVYLWRPIFKSQGEPGYTVNPKIANKICYNTETKKFYSGKKQYIIPIYKY